MSQNEPSRDFWYYYTPEGREEMYRQQAELRKELGIPPRPRPLTEERVREIVREEIAVAVGRVADAGHS